MTGLAVREGSVVSGKTRVSIAQSLFWALGFTRVHFSREAPFTPSGRGGWGGGVTTSMRMPLASSVSFFAPCRGGFAEAS